MMFRRKSKTDSVVLIGEPSVTVVLRRSAASRRLSLRVSRMDGRVTMSLPAWTDDAEALAFAQEKESWIRRNLAASVDVQVPMIGGSILFEGRIVEIVAGTGRVVRFEDETLAVPGPPERAPMRIGTFFKTLARERLAASSDHYAERLGHPYGRITLRDTRSRWGSCTSDGNLMYSWRLIMAPPEVLDYVAAHEVAHLLEMNHSSAYWANVARVFPDYRVRRRWLRENGQKLHAYRFRD